MRETRLSWAPRGLGCFSPCSSRARRWLTRAIVAVVSVNLGAATASAGVLTLYNSTGAHTFGSGVRAAGLTFFLSSEVLLVTSDSGALTQYDATGAHPLLGSGVRAAGVDFSSFGEALAVTSESGALTQYDAFGAHPLFGSGVQSADLAFGPSGEVLAVVSVSTAIPEPSPLVLFTTGLAGFSLWRRCKKD
jgi:hypothetical protein